MITIKNVKLSYGKKKIFKDLNLSFAPGILYNIYSPEAIGKTVFFNILTGKVKPETGRISGIPKRKFLIFENPEDNFLFTRFSDELRSVCPEFDIEKLNHDLNIIGIDLNVNEDLLINQISFTEKKILALVLALYSKFELYLFDSPFDMLNHKTIDFFLNKFHEKIISENSIFISFNRKSIEREYVKNIELI